jgi:hypothetical protein
MTAGFAHGTDAADPFDKVRRSWGLNQRSANLLEGPLGVETCGVSFRRRRSGLLMEG